ncbi:Na(+)/H(+) antiporter subunit B [Bacillus sp. FJAT-42376]|uniref:Na(+)/H(+) antiporter subunit B n=1 Tax=Bacillus sp. FJAT-42376 TaxID=2014076 RepID=UPI000F4D3425|nr:Na(+)/H(+) antiporter subunit B [Bacillus sp. FJAT-42376]AZB44224.1 Na(+)/H(+) antiporter subunit B [Bacillus sp. FJAT-42376]
MKRTNLKTNDLILQTVVKVVFFIIFIYSVYIFFAGHYTPGGGFVGGLMTSSAIVLLLLAYDVKTVAAVIPFNFLKIAATGLLLALGTGMASFFYKVPFLTHAHGPVHLPFFGEVELASATAFDLGVYLVVVGVTMTIIQTIGETE